MSLATEELRKEVRGELYEGLKFIGRAANLLRHNDMDRGISQSEATKSVDALAQVTATLTDRIDSLLAK